MTKLADLTFPGTFDDLAAMSSAELRALVGKLPNGAALHPKIASMGYHMNKAQRIDFIGFHHYGVGSAEAAAQALTEAEGKYAIHQAKKGKKSGKKAPKSGVSTNCAATAGKALASLANNLPIDTKLAAQLDDWAKLGKKPTSYDLDGFAKQVSEGSGLPETTGPALDNLFDLDDVLQSWKGVLKTADSSDYADAWVTSQQLSEAASKAQGLAPELAASAHAAAAEAAQKAVQSAAKNYSDEFAAIANFSPDNPASLVKSLEALAELNNKVLPPPTVKNLLNAGSDVIEALQDTPYPLIEELAGSDLAEKLANKYTASAQALPSKYADDVAAALPQHKLDNLADTITGVGEYVEAEDVQALAASVQAAQGSYETQTKAALKKLGVPAFEQAGVEIPSLAHYLTKPQLAEALAKLDFDQPIDELLKVAEAKKLAHKTKGKAAKTASKDPSPSGADALKAHPDTADVTDLTPAQAKTKAKAKTKAHPDTADKAEASVAPELTPAPETLGVPQTKYPKPPQTQHAWKPKAHQPNLGGAHTKHVYTDEDANIWMWKKANTEGVANGEILAHDIGWDLGFDMADIRYADGWQVPGKGTYPHGTVQKFHQGVKGDMRKVPVHAFTDQQLAELQEHQVFDWLISQHDTHSENILVMADGHLVPIDKGQAFKFFGKDKLEVGYSPPGNFGRPVYYDMWDEYAAGRLDLNLDAIDNVLARIETLDEADFTAKVRDYVKLRTQDRAAMDFLPKKLRSEDALVDAILARKRGIRDDFTKFYKEQAKRRGVKWDPIWDRRLADASPELLEELGEAAVKSGITTPVTEQLAADVQKLGTGGRALHLAGKDVHQGQALVWTERSTSGSTILRFETRLEIDADDRVTELLRSITGDLGTGNATTSPGFVVDAEWDTVVKYAKTVGAHAEDGAYNATTVAEAEQLIGSIKGKTKDQLVKAEKALGEGNVDSWAAAKAEADKLEQYAEHLDAIAQAQSQGVPPPYKAEPFDVAKAKEGWLAKAPDAPATKTAEPGADIFDKLAIGDDRFPVMERADGFMEFRRTGSSRQVRVSSHSSPADLPGPKLNSYGGNVGKQFDGVLRVDGVEIKLSFTSYQQTAAASRKGLIQAEVVGWQGDSATINRFLTMLGDLGVDAKLATIEDEALTYWRVLTGTMKGSVEYATGQGSGPYGKVRSTIDSIESKVAAAGDLSPSQEAALYRDAWTETFGADAVARAPEAITHRRNIFGDEMGYGFVHRFDLPEDLRPLFGQQGGYVHGTKHLSGDDVTSLAGTESTTELIRQGSIDLSPGQTTSASSDLYTGGADGTFSSPGWTGYASNQDFVIVRPAAADARVGTYGYTGDRFGSLSQRAKGHHLDPTKGIRGGIGRGETIIRGGASFGEDIEAVVYRTKAKQKQALAALRKEGVTEIRGRPIEDRILYARYDKDAQTLVREITAERADSMFRPYDDVGVKPRSAPAAKPKAKPKRQPKVKNPTPDPETPLASTETPAGGAEFNPGPVSAAPAPGEFTNAFSDVYDALHAKLPEIDSYSQMASQAVDFLSADLGISVPDAVELWTKAVKMSDVSGDLAQTLKNVSVNGADYHVLSSINKGKNALEQLDELLDYDWLDKPGGQQHIAELLGAPNFQEVKKAHALVAGSGDDLTDWLPKAVAEQHGLPAPPTVPSAVAQKAKGALKVDEDIAALNSAVPGEKVAHSPVEKVFNYNIPGVKGKLPVQFDKIGGKTKVLAQYEDGNWYMVIPDAQGKTSKDQLIQALLDLGWPGVQAP